MKKLKIPGPKKLKNFFKKKMNITAQDKLSSLYKELRRQGKGLQKPRNDEVKNYENPLEKFLPKKKLKIESLSPRKKLEMIWSVFEDIANGNTEQLLDIINFMNYIANPEYDDIYYPPNFGTSGDICSQILHFIKLNIVDNKGIRELLLAICYENGFEEKYHFYKIGEPCPPCFIETRYEFTDSSDEDQDLDSSEEECTPMMYCDQLVDHYLEKSIRKGCKIAFDYAHGKFELSFVDILATMNQYKIRKEVISLLLISNSKEESSLFYKENLPMDMFKLILKLV